jgi:UDP-N-acetylmuramate dehydrogenase
MGDWSDLIEAGIVHEDVTIGALTTYKLGGPARLFAEPGGRGDLQRVLDRWRDSDMELLILGRGSNVVVSDAGFDGLVLRLTGAFAEIAIMDDHVTAGAAVSLPILARTASKAGLSGLEFYVGIPGSVGGAVAMNAGCFGTETADVMTSADILDVASGVVRTATPRDLDMGYRSTTLDSASLVLGATFGARAGDPKVSEERMREITRWRRENQPGGTLNAGSVFKNPVDDAAGRIIDATGLKGFGVGAVRVSERHANFFVAEQGASADDIWRLVTEVQARVFEATGIRLEPEVRFAGSFGGER